MNKQKKLIAKNVDDYIHSNRGRIDIESIPKTHVKIWALSKKYIVTEPEDLKKVGEIEDVRVRNNIGKVLFDVGDIIRYARRSRNMIRVIFTCMMLFLIMGITSGGGEFLLNMVILMVTSPLTVGMMLFFNWKKKFWAKELIKHVCQNYDTLEEYNTLP